jgi:hypothetical protein
VIGAATAYTVSCERGSRPGQLEGSVERCSTGALVQRMPRIEQFESERSSALNGHSESGDREHTSQTPV